MKVRQTDTLPTCDFCSNPKEFVVDSPIRGSHAWANMCNTCFPKYGVDGDLGTKFVLRDRSNTPDPKDATLDVVDNTTEEDALWDSVREVTCPTCGEARSMEMDADSVFECEGCHQKLRIKPVF